ncbi:MAG: LysR family transcriptional regulator [Lachnospiraceae bacterium]|nr:LysR family transcriptional regulator [Lachnospiraceae bacterium]
MDRRVYDNYVIQIVEHGNLSKAAAYLGISQPALSSGLTALENELGFKIFNRRKVPITFTPEGELYFDYLKKMQVLADDFQQRLDSYHEERNSRVIIGGPVAYVESIVTDAVIALRKEHPNYRIEIKCSPLAELIDMSLKGEVSCFVSTSEDIPKNFETKRIKQEKIYLCVPKNNPLNKKIADCQVKPGERGKLFDYTLLDGEEFIFLEQGQPLHGQMEKFFEENGIVPVNKITVNQVSTAVNLVLKGEACCFASEGALEGNQDLGSICVYPLPDSISGRNIYVAYNKDLFMSGACRELIGHLVADHDNQSDV